MINKIMILASVLMTFPLLNSQTIDDLILPDGFHASIFADNLNSPRQITETHKGRIIVGSKQGDKIYALEDIDNDGFAESRYLIAKDLENPTGVTVHNENLYFSEIDKVWFIENIDTLIDNNIASPEKKLYLADLPYETWHGFKYIKFGPDDNLYIPVGVPCNICLEPQTKDKRFAAIHKYKDGNLITVADGVRNSVGFDWHPILGRLYFTDNGRDWLGDNSPSCELNMIDEEGSFFGYPYKHAKNVIDPDFGKLIKDIDKKFIDPIAELGPHVAPLGMTFYDNDKFPEKYRNSIFIALHGSWNKYNGKSGYKIIFIKLDEEGNFISQEDFITGWLIEENAWGRPVDPFVTRDGSMLISDDKHDVIYKIEYKD